MTRPYRRQVDVDAVGRDLSEVEMEIVRTVGQLRLVSAAQLGRLFFSDETGEQHARRTRYRLSVLVKHEVLARLPRRVGGFQAGSAGYVYRLGPVGHRLITASGTRNNWRPAEGFVRHTLAIAEAYTLLHELQARGDLALLRFEAEPECWRPFIGAGGEQQHLKPDGYLVFRSPGYEAHWYIEIDRGTESGPALRRKLDRYLKYFKAGHDQERLGLFPHVRFLITLSGTPSLQTESERVQQIEGLVAQLPEGAQRLFAVDELSELANRTRAGPEV